MLYLQLPFVRKGSVDLLPPSHSNLAEVLTTRENVFIMHFSLATAISLATVLLTPVTVLGNPMATPAPSLQHLEKRLRSRQLPSRLPQQHRNSRILLFNVHNHNSGCYPDLGE